MPAPRPSAIDHADKEGQDEFTSLDFDLDMTDPDLLAALGEDISTLAEVNTNELRVCEVSLAHRVPNFG